MTRACCCGPSASQSAGGQNRAEVDRVHHGIGCRRRIRLQSRTLDLPAGQLDRVAVLFFAINTSSSGAGEVAKVTRAVKGEFPDTSSAFRSTSLPSRYAAIQCCGVGCMSLANCTITGVRPTRSTPKGGRQGWPGSNWNRGAKYHGLALLRRPAGMLKEKADVLRLQRLVVELQLVEQPAQVRAHIAPCIAIGTTAESQHAVRCIGFSVKSLPRNVPLSAGVLPWPST